MTVYLKYIAEPIVQVGGTVATPEMLADGWFPYEGVVPVGDPLALIDGVLVPFEQVKGVMGWKNEGDRYIDAINYLKKTDHKTLSDYEPLPDEDLDVVKKARSESRATARAYEAKYLLPNGPTPPVDL